MANLSVGYDFSIEMRSRRQVREYSVDPYGDCCERTWLRGQTSWGKEISVSLQKGRRLFQGVMFRLAFLSLVREGPGRGTFRDLILGLLTDRNARRRKDPAVILATGLGSILVDRALVLDQHGAMAPVVVSH